MKVHEYQAKQVLKSYGIGVPEGILLTESDNSSLLHGPAASFTERKKKVVLKAQIHAGGRGKAGGVKICRSPDELVRAYHELIGRVLVTQQTGLEGKRVHQLWLEEVVEGGRQCYLSLLVDRDRGGFRFIASPEGGMNIEELARTRPDLLSFVDIDPVLGFRRFHSRLLAKALSLKSEAFQEAHHCLSRLFQCFRDKDCSLIEINPLQVQASGRLLALDAKIMFDDNGLYRHPDIAGLRDAREENPLEIEAQKRGFSFISLDGDIGCLVNGAGLAMATMDLIRGYGGMPANFLDVGGSASREKVKAAFEFILRNSKVRAILVNVFGGIMKCDVIAEGIVAAVRDLSLSVPLVVRLQGNRLEEGKKILAESGLKIILANGFDEAAHRVVRAAQEEARAA